MRRNLPFVIYLALLSLLAGWLMSRMSWIGRQGINFIHKEYKFLKVWYEAAAVVFIVLLVLFALGGLAKRYFSASGSRVYQIVTLLIAGAGLYYTYSDFHHDFTHKLLKENFHLGGYLFWIGWASISLFYLVMPRRISRQSFR